MTERKEPTDKFDRDEIEKLAETVFNWCFKIRKKLARKSGDFQSQVASPIGFYGYGGDPRGYEGIKLNERDRLFWEGLADRILANFVPRSDYELVLEELIAWQTGERTLA